MAILRREKSYHITGCYLSHFDMASSQMAIFIFLEMPYTHLNIRHGYQGRFLWSSRGPHRVCHSNTKIQSANQLKHNMSQSTTKTNKMTCAPSKDSDQSDQSSLCAQWVAKDPLGFFMWTAKTLIRLGRWPGWSESLLSAQVILLILSCCGLYSIKDSKHLFWQTS